MIFLGREVGSQQFQVLGIDTDTIVFKNDGHVFFAPINRATRLDPAVAAKVPYGQEQIGRMIKLDFEAMNDNVARWTERFNKEIERR